MITQFEIEEVLSKAIHTVNSMLQDLAQIKSENEQISEKIVEYYKIDPWREHQANILQNSQDINTHIKNSKIACKDLEETLDNLKDRFKELDAKDD